LMRIYLPFFFMTGINFAIVRKLTASRSKVSRQNPNQTFGNLQQDQSASAFTQSARQRKMTQATIIMDLIFLIFLTPVGVNLTLNIVGTYTTIFSSSVLADRINSFYGNMAMLMAYSFHVIDFFVYLKFNRYFREEFIVTFRLTRVFANQVSTTTTTMAGRTHVPRGQTVIGNS
jgi:hypothetical protein